MVQLSYDGGWLTDWKSATAYYRIYATGDVFKATRDGRIFHLGKIDRNTVDSIRDQINDPEVLANFVKKERSFCASAVDGIDSEISFTNSEGDILRYFDCDYDFGSENNLFKTVRSIVNNYKN